MPDDVLYRFPFGSLDKPRSDRALREILQEHFGVQIDAEEPAPTMADDLPPDDIEYEVAIPAKIARQRHSPRDAPLPPADGGMFMGLYTIRSDEEGAVLVLPWAENAHVWSIMSEIADAVARSLGGWREPSDLDEHTDPNIRSRPDGVPRSRSERPPRPDPVAPAPASQPTVQVAVPQMARSLRTPPPPSMETQPNTKPSIPAAPPDGQAVHAFDDDEVDDDQDLDRVFPDWESLKAWVAEAYSLEEDEDRSFKVVMTWSATTRRQTVQVLHSTVAGEEWITFRSGVCRRDRISAEHALRKSADLAFASLVGIGDRYDLAYSFPLPGLTLERFTGLLERIAELADDLEDELTRGGDEF
jgi:hypothetical protein